MFLCIVREIFVFDENIEFNVKLINNLFTKRRVGQRFDIPKNGLFVKF
jgi:hypothetical protein